MVVAVHKAEKQAETASEQKQPPAWQPRLASHGELGHVGELLNVKGRDSPEFDSWLELLLGLSSASMAEL
jgi:hypothetical protein